MSLIDQIKQYSEKTEFPLEFYSKVRELLRVASAKGEVSDALADSFWDAISGYMTAAQFLFANGHPAAADSLLIEAWNERGNRQIAERKRVYKAAIAFKLADLYLRRGDYGAALRWALLTQADDILGEHEKRGGAGQWQLRTVLGMDEPTLERLNKTADQNRIRIKDLHNDDWSRSAGFAEDVVLRFVLNTENAGLFARVSSVREFPLSNAYFKALLDSVDIAGTTEEKGKALEDLASYLFLLIPSWIPRRNVLDESLAFETDLVVRNLNPSGNLTAELLGRHFLVECKNWANPVGVRDVGYFLYRMRLTHAKFGVIFASGGVTGDKSNAADETAARELIRKAFHEDGNTCVVINRTDLDSLRYDRTTFWSMLLERVELLRFGKPRHS